jgi:hypothetical protein
MVSWAAFPLIIMELGDVAMIVFIKMYLKFYVKILVRNLLFLDLLETFTSDWTSEWALITTFQIISYDFKLHT